MGELGRGHLYGPEGFQKVPEGSINVSGTTVRERPKGVKGVCACESQPRNTTLSYTPSVTAMAGGWEEG
jgi:hypothetical protein